MLLASCASLCCLFLDFILSAGTIPKQTSKIIFLLEFSVKFPVVSIQNQLKTGFYRLGEFIQLSDFEFYVKDFILIQEFPTLCMF